MKHPWTTRSHRLGLALLTSLALMSQASSARAQGVGVPTIDRDEFNTYFAVMSTALASPPIIANGFHLARKKRTSPAWPVAGLVLGSAGVGIGAAFILPNLGGPDWSSGSSRRVGWAFAGVGAANFVMGACALTLPGRDPETPPTAYRWALAPTFARDDRRGNVYGAVLTFSPRR